MKECIRSFCLECPIRRGNFAKHVYRTIARDNLLLIDSTHFLNHIEPINRKRIYLKIYE